MLRFLMIPAVVLLAGLFSTAHANPLVTTGRMVADLQIAQAVPCPPAVPANALVDCGGGINPYGNPIVTSEPFGFAGQEGPDTAAASEPSEPSEPGEGPGNGEGEGPGNGEGEGPGNGEGEGPGNGEGENGEGENGEGENGEGENGEGDNGSVK